MNAGTGRFSGDAEMTVVNALVHVSEKNGAYIGPKSRTERPIGLGRLKLAQM